MINKVNILAFGAHPDDVECAANGVLIKHIEMGKTLVIIDLTAGEMRSFGSREESRKEAIKLYNEIRLHLSLDYRIPNWVYKLTA